MIFLAISTTLIGVSCTSEKIENYQISNNSTNHQTNKQNLPILKIGILPNRNPELQAKMIKQLTEYLEKSLGQSVKVYTAANYEQTVDWLVREKINMAYVGPSTYLEAVEKGAKIEPLVAPIDKITGQPWYRSCIIVSSNSTIKNLAELKEKRFSFVDKSSTSGYLLPLVELIKLNINPEKDFKQIIYAGNHTKSIEALEDGLVDAAATNLPAYIKYQKSHQKSQKNLPPKSRILWESEPIPLSPIVVSQKLPAELIVKLKKAFINTPEGMEDITGTESAGYTLVVPSDYELIEKMRQQLKL